MAKLKHYCTRQWIDSNGVEKECGMLLEIVESSKIGDDVLLTYRCGHMAIEPKGLNAKTAQSSEWRKSSIDGSKTLWDYQVEGVQKGIDSNYNLLIADQMALGKTPQALMIFASAYEKLSPALIVVRSSTTWQWTAQYKTWCDNLPLGVFVIQGTKTFIPPTFNAYIISMDSLGREGMIDKLLPFGFKLLIIDECHSFKDPSSKRTQALVKLIECGEIKHKILLSGTPIKNRADEYFVPLNLLAPEKFSSQAQFRYRWLEQDDKNKWGRIKDYKVQEFREAIAPHVIRRERNEVLKDLPPFKRTYTEVVIENEALKKLYNSELERLEEKLGKKMTFLDLQENLMTLRRITGLSKAQWAVDYVEQFLEETENEKIAIGIHHHGVRDLLRAQFNNKPFGKDVLYLGGEDNAERKYRIVNEFAKPERRVLVIGMLAGGVGLDGLQVCNNIVTLERQWSAADEEQFEDRFNRPGQLLPVTAEYPLAKGTVDVFFNGLVEMKREIFGNTVGNNWSLTSDNGSLRELAEWAVSHRI